MTVGTYILDGHQVVPEPDLLKWAKWFEDINNRRVAWTEIPGGYVSTVFLGLDHNFSGNGPPLVFETMVFMRDQAYYRSDLQNRCSTWAEAIDQHALIVEETNRRRSIIFSE